MRENKLLRICFPILLFAILIVGRGYTTAAIVQNDLSLRDTQLHETLAAAGLGVPSPMPLPLPLSISSNGAFGSEMAKGNANWNFLSGSGSASRVAGPAVVGTGAFDRATQDVSIADTLTFTLLNSKINPVGVTLTYGWNTSFSLVALQDPTMITSFVTGADWRYRTQMGSDTLTAGGELLPAGIGGSAGYRGDPSGLITHTTPITFGAPIQFSTSIEFDAAAAAKGPSFASYDFAMGWAGTVLHDAAGSKLVPGVDYIVGGNATDQNGQAIPWARSVSVPDPGLDLIGSIGALIGCSARRRRLPI